MLLEPLAPGQIGPAAAGGVAVVRLADSGAWYECAQPIPGDCAQMQSVPDGPARILCQGYHAGSQQMWGLIQFVQDPRTHVLPFRLKAGFQSSYADDEYWFDVHPQVHNPQGPPAPDTTATVRIYANQVGIGGMGPVPDFLGARGVAVLNHDNATPRQSFLPRWQLLVLEPPAQAVHFQIESDGRPYLLRDGGPGYCGGYSPIPQGSGYHLQLMWGWWKGVYNPQAGVGATGWAVFGGFVYSSSLDAYLPSYQVVSCDYDGVPPSLSYELEVVTAVDFATGQYTTRKLFSPAGLKLGDPVMH